MSKKSFNQLMKDPFTHELIAFGWGNSKKPFYTIRDSIAEALSDANIQNECPKVFGADFITVVTAIQKYADLDKKYYPDNLLEAAE